MGGSFNPPTLAHCILMREAINALDAEKGFFVPVSDAYLRRKMRHDHPPVVLSPEMRVKMLQTMCTEGCISVCTKEIGAVEARTMPTLMELQDEYPDANLYFLIGADKLELLIHLAEKRNFLEMFNIILYSRDKTEIEIRLKENNILSQYQQRIITLPQPEGTDAISSSKVRERRLAGESYQDMLCPGVWELFKGFSHVDFPDTINRFKDEYGFLSNRFAYPFVWEGLRYANAEAAFQSSKCTDITERKVFCNCSADNAVLKGRDIVPYSGWERERLEIMTSILTAKFEQNQNLMEKLIETGDTLLINGNSKHDMFWGVDLYGWQGENNLGKILMTIRNKEKQQ